MRQPPLPRARQRMCRADRRRRRMLVQVRPRAESDPLGRLAIALRAAGGGQLPRRGRLPYFSDWVSGWWSARL
jgi:hypothetical protein